MYRPSCRRAVRGDAGEFARRAGACHIVCPVRTLVKSMSRRVKLAFFYHRQRRLRKYLAQRRMQADDVFKRAVAGANDALHLARQVGRQGIKQRIQHLYIQILGNRMPVGFALGAQRDDAKDCRVDAVHRGSAVKPDHGQRF